MHRRAHVVTEPLEGEGLGPGPPSDRRFPLEDLHPETRPGQRQRRGKAVGPRADHDGICTLHAATLQSVALPGAAAPRGALAHGPQGQ